VLVESANARLAAPNLIDIRFSPLVTTGFLARLLGAFRLSGDLEQKRAKGQISS
jgi:hypothetical protein